MRVTKTTVARLCKAYDNNLLKPMKRAVNGETCLGCAVMLELSERKPKDRRQSLLTRAERWVNKLTPQGELCAR